MRNLLQRGPSIVHAPTCCRDRRCGPKVRSVALAILAVLLLHASWLGSCAAGEKELKPPSYGYFDFPTCVRYALVHSDAFISSRINIQVRSVDLKDAHSEVLPTLQLLTRYYFTRARTTTGEGSRFNVQLFMTGWNPYLALLKVKSGQILVDIAKTAHADKIAENTSAIAKAFYSIAMIEKSMRAQKEIVALQRNRLNYSRSLNEQGSIDELELRGMTNALKGMEIRIKTLKNQRDEQIATLKTLIGYPPDHYLPLDTRDAVRQILGGFNGETVTFPEIQGNNWSLKILAKKEQLQSNYVTGSYVALLPRPVILFEDIQNQVDRTSGFNFALGFDYTLWDGFRRVRDIKRQKLNAQDAEIRRKRASEEIYGAFQRIRGTLATAGESESHAREEVKLAELAEEKAFLGYKSGNIPYSEYMSSRIQKVRAQVGALETSQTRVLNLIELATMAGGLNRYHAGIRF